MIENIRKYGKLMILIVGILGFLYWGVWEQNWIKGVKLNPYQIDEVELIIRNAGTLYHQQGVRIHDKKFIRMVLNEMKKADFIQEAFPLDESIIKGNKYLLLVRDGQTIQAHVEIYSGKEEGFSDEGVMLIGDRYYYRIPNSIKQLFQLESKEIAQEVRNADKWFHWRPFVIIDDQPYYAQYVGKQWSDTEFTKKLVVNKTLSQPTIMPIEQDHQSLLKDRVATGYPVGTDIYKANGIYFVKSEKESNNWSVLLPYGQGAHWLGLEQEGEVEYWSGQFTSYFIVRNSDKDVFVLSSQDPAFPEKCTLQWDKDKRLFVSTRTSVTYDITGKSTKEGYAPMQRFASKVWKDVVFFSYY